LSRHILSELKIPAEHEFVGVAKAVASRLGSRLGFNLENLDELGIAVTQACESAIEAGEQSWGQGSSLKLTYTQTELGLAVEVQALPPRSKEALPARPAAAGQDELQRVAHEMIRSFVDDFQTKVEARRLRISMVKYLIG
jgi:hypothetical protein